MRPEVPVFKIEMDSYRISLLMFKRDVSRYPTVSEGLRALATTTGDSRWRGPYTEGDLIDPWGRCYVYAPIGGMSPHGYILSSLRPDGKRSPDDYKIAKKSISPSCPAPLSHADVVRQKMKYSEDRNLPIDQVIALYRANDWSSANKPELLLNALRNSHSLICAWDGEKLIGLGNAISDGFLVVYYPHLLVLPDYQGRGIGTEIMRIMKQKYAGFHMHMLTADGRAIDFYKKCGFERAGQTEPMWIYSGGDH